MILRPGSRLSEQNVGEAMEYERDTVALAEMINDIHRTFQNVYAATTTLTMSA